MKLIGALHRLSLSSMNLDFTVFAPQKKKKKKELSEMIVTDSYEAMFIRKIILF